MLYNYTTDNTEAKCVLVKNLTAIWPSNEMGQSRMRCRSGIKKISRGRNLRSNQSQYFELRIYAMK
jgi:hypothetical protein